jgi:hypothetical protein
VKEREKVKGVTSECKESEVEMARQVEVNLDTRNLRWEEALNCPYLRREMRVDVRQVERRAIEIKREDNVITVKRESGDGSDDEDVVETSLP